MDNPQEHIEIIPGEVKDVNADEVTDLVPEMPVPQVVPSEGTSELISDEDLLGAFDEVKGLLQEDREQIKDLTLKIADMVINGGDASPSSKEALSSLLKTQTDLIDKMVKVADLKTRLKMKDRNTISDGMMAKIKQTQTNNFNIQGGKRTTRLLIDAIH